MNPSIACIRLISEFEGLRLKPYTELSGDATIGYGHQIHRGPATIADDEKYAGFDESAAEQLLIDDLDGTVSVVSTTIRVPMLQNQFDALCSFCYNVGPDNFRHSTLVRLFNSGANVSASREFDKWDKCNGAVLGGLVRRRAAEKKMFMGV